MEIKVTNCDCLQLMYNHWNEETDETYIVFGTKLQQISVTVYGNHRIEKIVKEGNDVGSNERTTIFNVTPVSKEGA